jgi:hypothetical protein
VNVWEIFRSCYMDTFERLLSSTVRRFINLRTQGKAATDRTTLEKCLSECQMYIFVVESGPFLCGGTSAEGATSPRFPYKTGFMTLSLNPLSCALSGFQSNCHCPFLIRHAGAVDDLLMMAQS